MKTPKRNKAQGTDGLQGDLIRIATPSTAKAYCNLCLSIWESETWPKRWCQSIMIPIHKKNCKSTCRNYRTHSLISHPSKILLKIMLNRILITTSRILDHEQAGFSKGRCTIHQIFTINQLAENTLKWKKIFTMHPSTSKKPSIVLITIFFGCPCCTSASTTRSSPSLSHSMTTLNATSD